MAHQLTGKTIASTFEQLIYRSTTQPSTGTTTTQLMTSENDQTDDVGLPLYISTQRVGIGTNAPADILEVQGTTHAHIGIDSATGYDAGLKLRENGTEKWFIYNNGDDSDKLYINDDGATRVVIDQNGQVGIGVTAPGRLLEVSGAGNAATIEIASTGTGNGRLIFSDDGSTVAKYEYSSDHMYTDAGGHVWQNANGSVEYMRILTNSTSYSTGQLGIGTNAPIAHLDVHDQTIEIADNDYIGIRNYNIITLGDSSNDDTHKGIFNYMVFNDASEEFASLYGIQSDVRSINTASAESQAIFGIANYTTLNNNTDVDYVYGDYNSVDIDGGTVRTHVFTQVVAADISGGTLSSNLFGTYIDINTTVNPTGACYGLYINMDGAGCDIATDYFMYLYDNLTNLVRGHITMAGVATFDQGSFSDATDYAEWFESKDGVAIEIGATVKLDNGKIVSCKEGDVPMGAVRPKDAAVIQGGGAQFGWQGQFLTDDYGSHIYEDCEWVIWKEDIDFAEFKKGNKLDKPSYNKVDGQDGAPDTYYKEYSYYADRVPEEYTIPKDAKISPAQPRRKQNPDYDPSREYVSREDRDEWYLVGLLGQVPITKGQPVGSWTKMNEVSDSVDMYYIFPQANKNQQGDSSNEQDQEQSAGSGDSGGDASSESSGEDSGGVEGSSSDSSGADESGADSSESGSDSSSDSSVEDSEDAGSSGSDASDDSEGGSGEDDSAGEGEPSEEWTKDQLKAYMDENSIEYNSGDTKQDLLDKITLAGEGPDEG